LGHAAGAEPTTLEQPPRSQRPRTRSAATSRTTFFGRGSDLDQLHAIVSRGAQLVTLTGPGGTGKTRLARRYAEVHGDEFTATEGGGSWFCDLTETRSLDAVCGAVASMLGTNMGFGTSASDAVTLVGQS